MNPSLWTEVDRAGGAEEKEGGAREEVKSVVAVGPQSKGKKNAYSNSVQKMTCPFCPRVFPWASSLQRHMLTHTGETQKRAKCWPKSQAQPGFTEQLMTSIACFLNTTYSSKLQTRGHFTVTFL